MRQYSSKIILITTIIIIFAGYFTFREIIYPSYLNNVSQERKVLLNEEQELVLLKRQEQSSIFGLEIEISPNKKGNYAVHITDMKDQNFDVLVKENKELVYKTEWYSDSCIMKFVPEKSAKDSVEITYRFLGLND